MPAFRRHVDHESVALFDIYVTRSDETLQTRGCEESRLSTWLSFPLAMPRPFRPAVQRSGRGYRGDGAVF